MITEWLGLWRSLHDGEYLYLVLESLLPFGLAAGALVLVLGLLLKDLRVRLAGLVVVVLTCATVWPATTMRRAALPRMLAMTEEVAFQKLMADQAQRRAGWNGLYYGLALLAAVAGLRTVLGKGGVVCWVALVGMLMGAVHGLWLHKKEAEVFHRNIVKHHG
jgi:hypothetical protein